MEGLTLNLEERLHEAKSKILQNMELDIHKGDVKKLLSWSELLQESEKLLISLQDVVLSVDKLESRLKFKISLGDAEMEPSKLNSLEVNTRTRAQQVRHAEIAHTAREEDSVRSESLRKAQKCREEIVREMREGYGVILRPISKTLYETESGKIVGMAFATERTPGRWFLGLPERDYFAMILVCEKESGEQKRFVLPEPFCEKYADRLSTSGKQYKFNISERSGRFEFMVPGGGIEGITRYIDSFDALTERRVER